METSVDPMCSLGRLQSVHAHFTDQKSGITLAYFVRSTPFFRQWDADNVGFLVAPPFTL